MNKTPRRITFELIRRYVVYLREQERAAHTVQKYTHNLEELAAYLDGQTVTKAALIEWKDRLTDAHSPATVNSKITAANGFFTFMGWRDLSLRLLKIQKIIFCDEKRELTRAEYVRLVEAAEQEGNQRLSLVLQTICATGIRVSELRFITVEAVCVGRAEIFNKGKRRVVFLPDKLRKTANEIPPSAKKDRRGGVYHPDG